MKNSDKQLNSVPDSYRLVIAYTLILLGIVSRLLPHPPNFTPVAALALFGGVYLDRRYAMWIMVAIMLISDLFLGFHNTMPYVYGSFAAIALMGVWLKRHFSLWIIGGTAITGSLLFFLVTNFGAWLHSGLYPQTLAGLMQSYVMGIPFYRNTLGGDLFYTAIFFGAYELIHYFIERRLAWQKASN